MDQSEGEPLGFFQYVFKFGNDEKAVMLNIIQHTLFSYHSYYSITQGCEGIRT